MTSKSSEHRDPLLGQKLDHVARVVGHLFPNGHFSNKRLAAELALGEAQMSRKRNGDRPIDNQELCKLLIYCGLGRLTVEDLKTPTVEALDAILRREEVGIYGARDADALRHGWLSDHARRAGAIRIESGTARRAGLGAPEERRPAVPYFRMGATAWVVVQPRGDGHLVLLSDDYLRREATCLMPSTYAPTTAASAGETSIPFRNIDVEPVFTVFGPPAWCRLFAFWSPERWPLGFLPHGPSRRKPFDLTMHQLRELAAAVDWRRRHSVAYEVLTAEYRVVE